MQAEVFTALHRWGTRQCQKRLGKGATVTTEELREELQDLLPLVRYNCMTLDHVAMNVAYTNLIPPDVIGYLLTRIVTQDRKMPLDILPTQHAGFRLNSPTRKQYRPRMFDIRFDAQHCPAGIRLSENDLVATKLGSGWKSIRCARVMKSGIHYCELRLLKTSNNCIIFGAIDLNGTSAYLDHVMAVAKIYV